MPVNVKASATERLDPIVWKVCGVALLGPLMTNLDSTVVNVSLSTLGSELHTPLTTIQWVASGYLLALALMLPLSGWIVDRIGAKRLYLGCFTAFTLTSLLCGAATSASTLIASRVLQGMAGGLLAPMAQMMVARVAGRHLARVMSIMVMPILIGPILGPVLAGMILQHAGWRWIFFVNLPVGILAIALALWMLPNDSHDINPRALDIKGFLLLSPGLVLLLHSLESLSTQTASKNLSRVELVTAVFLIAAFIRHALRLGKDALINLYLFRRPSFNSAACTQFLTNAAAFGGQLLLPLYLLTILGISPSHTGLLLAPAGLGMFCVYPFMGTLTERFGSRAVALAGATVAFLGTLPFALFAGHGFSIAFLCASLFIRGAGQGSIGIPSVAVAYTSIPKPMIPVATTTINIVQRTGGPIATTLLTIFLHAKMKALPAHAPQAFAATFRILCVIHVCILLAALRLPVRKEENREQDEAAFAEAVTE